MPIRILLVDNHDIVRRSLRAVPAGETAMDVTVNELDAVEKAERCKPNVVLMDISTPELNGLEGARRRRNTSPSVEVLYVLTHVDDRANSPRAGIGLAAASSGCSRRSPIWWSARCC